jgi:RNA polymerase sigma factor (sigma-70 family)
MSRMGDDGLLLGAARGEVAALEEFYRRWLPAVTSYHLRRVRVPEVAFDLTAETFAAVVVSCRGFDPERGPAAAWLFSIAEHKLVDSLRRGRVEARARAELGHQPILLEDEDLIRVEELASLGISERLRSLLAALPDAQRAAVLARVVDESSYREIAVELQCSQAVVRQRVHRGLSRLKDQLREPA